MSRLRLAGAAVIAVSALVVACGGDGVGLRGITRAEPLQVGAVELPDVTDGAAPDLTFAFRAEPGRLLLVYFGFTSCPDVCPTTLSDVRSALQRLGPDLASRVRLAMVTVDPDRDTPDVLNRYVGSFVADYRVLRPASAEQLRRAEQPFLATSSVTTGAGGRPEVSHTATLYAVDDTGTVLVEWPFGTSAGSIADDLRRLLRSP